MVVVNFTSPASPPNNISGFQIERSRRSASGSIASAPAVNNTTKVITVTFDDAVTAGALIGDQMLIDGLLYSIVGNTSNTITFSSTTDLSSIVTFPATFVVLNDLAEFSDFDVVGSVTPTLPFNQSFIHQFTDASGSIFDFYKIKSIDSGGTVSRSYLSGAFRPGQVVSLALDEKRSDPKDTLVGVRGGSITFEVEVVMGGRKQDPKDNVVYGEIYAPAYMSNTANILHLDTIQLVRVGVGRYRATWNVPNSVGSFTLYPNEDYFIVYKANFFNMAANVMDSLIEFESEFFAITAAQGPIAGRFPSYARPEDVRMMLFNIDGYLPESVAKNDLEARNKIISYHLETASDKLREELNLHQIRASSMDRKEYVAARAIYTLLMASKSQNGSAISTQFLQEWKDRFDDIMDQLKREGSTQGIPMGRG
jgi:hypothetical protein